MDCSPESWHVLAAAAKEIWFKDISIFSSGCHVVQLCWTFCWGHHEEHFSKIILNLDQCLRRRMMSLKEIPYLELWQPPFQWRKTFCAILVDGIMRNISEKLFWIWTSGSVDVVEDVSHLELWQPLCSVERNHICNFCRGHYGEHSCEIILNLNQWFRGRCRYRRSTTDGHKPIIIAL